MRQFMTIVEGFIGAAPARAFGRRGVTPDAPQPINPVHPGMLRAVQKARQYASAEQYADDNNPVNRMNSDPDHIHQSYDEERRRLVRQWNLWKDSGYI